MSDERKELSKEELLGITTAVFQYFLSSCNYKETSKKYNQACKQVCNLIQQKPEIDESWFPTAENINALPDPTRKYIHDLETNADPPGMIQENALLRDPCKQLEAKLARQKPKIDEAFTEEATREWLNENKHRYEGEIFNVALLAKIAKDFVYQTISETKGLQDVPVVKIKKKGD